ncbi:MAG: CapA family protein, partial [Anaerolineales bacterium]
PANTPTPVSASPTAPTPESAYLHPAVPDFLRGLAVGLPLTDDPTQAARLIQPAAASDAQSTWVYALVAPFPTLIDSITLTDLQALWAGDPSGPLNGLGLVMDDSTQAAMTLLLGPPASGVVRAAPADQVLSTAWAAQPGLWAIVPFEALVPQWKVIALDDQSPIHKDFDLTAYPLKLGFTAQGFTLPASNRDPNKLTTLLMTGVTALVRATAYKMEQKGLTYPAQDVGDLMRNADILHISNEIPFAKDCPTPDPYQTRLIFCSDPRYIELMEYIGTDVVELTGNHFADWGTAATLMTMDMYDERGWPYYGGGRNLKDAHQPAIMEHNGNRIGFVGCNPVGPDFAWATETRPGAAACEDLAWMRVAVGNLKAQGILPVATFQHFEYYTPEPRPNQVRDFRAMVEAGAAIVSGSQAHSPQAMEFYNGTFIHYGLGNLFFDQMHTDRDTRKEFADRYVIYDGRVISVEIFTFMLEDYARPRFMTPGERADLLSYIWSYTNWSILP